MCAAEALGQIGDAHAVGPLIAALKDLVSHKATEGPPWQISHARTVNPRIATPKKCGGSMRNAATNALVKTGRPAVDPLIAALKDGDYSVREAAADTLGQIGDARGAEPLIAALKDGTSSVRTAAAGALVKIGRAAVEPLIAVLVDSVSNDLRECAAALLGNIGDSRAVEWLVLALGDSHWGVHQRAVNALGKIGAPAVELLIATLSDSKMLARSGAVNALVTIGRPVVEPLIAALTNVDSQVRSSAAEALGRIGDARAIAPLLAALKDGDLRMRKTAADALVKIGWPSHDERAVVPLIHSLRFSSGTSHDAGQKVVEDSLVRIGAPAVRLLIVAVNELSGWPNRKAAAELLLRLYRSGHLDETHKQLILAQRGYFSEAHNDGIFDADRCGNGEHTDMGIGVAFPV
jgi:HEAT repeat protein